jgi:hypothetical protein
MESKKLLVVHDPNTEKNYIHHNICILQRMITSTFYWFLYQMESIVKAEKRNREKQIPGIMVLFSRPWSSQ